MLSFRKRLMSVLSSADDIGSDNAEMGDVIALMCSILDDNPNMQGCRLGDTVNKAVEDAHSIYNHPAAHQLLVDIRDCFIDYKIDLAQAKKSM